MEHNMVRWLLAAASTLALSCGNAGSLQIARSGPALADYTGRPELPSPRLGCPQGADDRLAFAARNVDDALEAGARSETLEAEVYDVPSTPMVNDGEEEAAPLCYINHPVLSQFDHTLTIGVSSISATDIITNKLLIIEFRTSAPLCQGYENALERHFYLRKSQYEPMLDAIDDGKLILITGIESPEDKFVQVSWRAQ